MIESTVPQEQPFHKASDRGMSLTIWLEWIADTIIKMHDRGCSDNQVRFWLCSEFDRRYGHGEVK